MLLEKGWEVLILFLDKEFYHQVHRLMPCAATIANCDHIHVSIVDMDSNIYILVGTKSFNAYTLDKKYIVGSDVHGLPINWE